MSATVQKKKKERGLISSDSQYCPMQTLVILNISKLKIFLKSATIKDWKNKLHASDFPSMVLKASLIINAKYKICSTEFLSCYKKTSGSCGEREN